MVCPCGTYFEGHYCERCQNYTYASFHHGYAHVDQTHESEIDANGNSHDTWTSVCTGCQTTFVYEAYCDPVVNCTRTKYNAYKWGLGEDGSYANIAIHVMIDPEHAIEEKKVSTENADGTRTDEFTYQCTECGHIDHTRTELYNANGLLMESKVMQQTDVFDYVCYSTYEYNELGQLVTEIREESRSEPGYNNSRDVYCYIYDENGNQYRISYENTQFYTGEERLHSSYTETCEYDDAFRMTCQRINSASNYMDSYDNSVKTWEYNEDGILIKETSERNCNNGLNHYYVYEYTVSPTHGPLLVKQESSAWEFGYEGEKTFCNIYNEYDDQFRLVSQSEEREIGTTICQYVYNGDSTVRYPSYEERIDNMDPSCNYVKTYTYDFEAGVCRWTIVWNNGTTEGGEYNV